jgi:hypothetical protein
MVEAVRLGRVRLLRPDRVCGLDGRGLLRWHALDLDISTRK